MLDSYAMAKGHASRGTKLELLQGTLDLMVLQTLDTMGPQHGYGIARRIEQTSGDILKLNEGTVYAALDAAPASAMDFVELGHLGGQSQGQVLRDYRQPASVSWHARSRRGISSQAWSPGCAGRSRADMWTRLRAIVSRLTFMLARRRLDEDLRLEIDAHLESLTEHYRRQGMSPRRGVYRRAAAVR